MLEQCATVKEKTWESEIFPSSYMLPSGIGAGEELPMTMQVVMLGTDGIVLGSDLKWVYSSDPVRTSHLGPKIKLNPSLDVAVSCARSLEVSRPIADAVLSLDDAAWTTPIVSIQTAAKDAVGQFGAGRPDAQCLIVAAKPSLRAYRLEIANYPNGTSMPVCEEVTGYALAGDKSNSAVFWVERYYKKQPISNLLRLASQLIVSASKLNSGAIAGLELVTCSPKGFNRLPGESVDELERNALCLDQSLDFSETSDSSAI
jgi:hypothetical protein